MALLQLLLFPLAAPSSLSALCKILSQSLGYAKFSLVSKSEVGSFGLVTYTSCTKPPNSRTPLHNYLKSLVRKLDSYICYVLNDSAYLCAPLLCFLTCPIALESLWESRAVLEPVSVLGRVNTEVAISPIPCLSYTRKPVPSGPPL